MDILVIEKNLIDNKMSVDELSDIEVDFLINLIKNDILKKTKELEELNQKIRNLKIKIDNWEN
jgi:hypothetical protein